MRQTKRKRPNKTTTNKQKWNEQRNRVAASRISKIAQPAEGYYYQ